MNPLKNEIIQAKKKFYCHTFHFIYFGNIPFLILMFIFIVLTIEHFSKELSDANNYLNAEHKAFVVQDTQTVNK